MGDDHFYKVFLPKTVDFDSLTVFRSSIIGNTEVFVSRFTRFPSFKDSEQVIFSFMDSIEFSVAEFNLTAGDTLYIKVHASSQS